MNVSQQTATLLETAMGNRAAARELLTALGMPFIPGKVFFVQSTSPQVSDSNPGTVKNYPLATIAKALELVAALTSPTNAGHVIFVLPGHAESFATDLDITTSHNGVSIIGIGVGESRPILTFTATGAKVDIDGANVRFAGFVLKNDIDSQTVMIDVDGAGAVIEDNEILEGSAKQCLIGIDLGADRPTVRRNYIKSVTAGADSGIKISAAIDRPHILDNEIFGDFSDAAIHNPTSAVATRVLIKGNCLTNLQSGDHAIELVSACTGNIEFNTVNSTLAAVGTKTAIDPGSCYCNENYGSDGVGDVSGVINPALDA